MIQHKRVELGFRLFTFWALDISKHSMLNVVQHPAFHILPAALEFCSQSHEHTGHSSCNAKMRPIKYILLVYGTLLHTRLKRKGDGIVLQIP
jgi:hypothetical protein